MIFIILRLFFGFVSYRWFIDKRTITRYPYLYCVNPFNSGFIFWVVALSETILEFIIIMAIFVG